MKHCEQGLWICAIVMCIAMLFLTLSFALNESGCYITMVLVVIWASMAVGWHLKDCLDRGDWD